MRIFRAVSFAVLMAFLHSAEVVAAEDATPFKIQKLTDTVRVLMGEGGNIGVSAGTDGIFIIDDNYEGDGDAIVRFRDSNIVHAGDVFLNGIYPFIDVDSGGTFAGSIAAVDALLALIDDQTMIIPGHGPVATQSDVRAFREMYAAIGDKVTAMKANGLSLEEVLTAGPADAFDGRWNSWGDDWNRISLTSIYRSLP